MTIAVHVTQEHIDKGCKWSCARCPVALAMLAAGLKDISVGGYFIRWWDDRICEMRTPSKVDRFMRNFDTGRKVSPFTFELTDEREGA
jgi:hypothetical protein